MLYQALLVEIPEVNKVPDELFIVFPGVQLSQQVQVDEPLLITQGPSDCLSQMRVRTLYPSTLRHPICQGNYLLGVHLMEIPEDEGPQDVRVLHGDAIYLVAGEEAQICHPDVHRGVLATDLYYAHS